MMTEIIRGMKLTPVEQFTTIHNYIDTENMILRKGSVSAQAGEKLIIPINMRDGSLICTGKGNPDWNFLRSPRCGTAHEPRRSQAELYRKRVQKADGGHLYHICESGHTG